MSVSFVKKKYVIRIALGVLMAVGLFGCGKTKYDLSFDGSGFKARKHSYAEGETVKCIYGMVATDTSYDFRADSDDVKLDVEFDGNHSYIITFTMPAHDVKISLKKHSTMVIDENAYEESLEGQGEPDGQGDLKDRISNENLLFDHYEAVVATDGGDGHTEYCLYKYNDQELILALYNKKADAKETMDYCLVPYSVLNDCMELADRYKMIEWKNGTGLDGKKYVVKFMVDGKLKRVSSDEMPEGGVEAFEHIGNVLRSAWDQASRSM